MSGTVVVRLTDAQRGALRSIAAITVECGEGSPALAAALAALDNATPALTAAQQDAITDAAALADAEWEGDGRGGNRRRRTLDDATAKIHRAMRP